MMRTISTEGWELFSARPNSVNYMSADGTRLLKTSSETVSLQLEDLQQEIELSESVAAMGVPTPRVLEIVQMEEGGYGLISEYVQNKKSLARILRDEPERLDECVRLLAAMGEKLHATPCDTAKFPSRTASAHEALGRWRELFSESEYAIVQKTFDSVPDGTACVHGDFQPGNIITAPSGTFFIDLATFSYGNPLIDEAHLYGFTCLYQGALDTILHLTPEQGREVWNRYVQYSHGIDDPAQRREFERTLAPYVLIDCIAMIDISNRTDMFLKYRDQLINDDLLELIG